MKQFFNIVIVMLISNILLVLVASFIGFIHPNGGILAYTITNSEQNSFVILTDVLTGQSIELTQYTGDGDITGRTPQWSLDGERVSFWVYQNRTDTIAYELEIDTYDLNNLSEQTDFFSLPIYGANDQALYATLPTFLNVPLYLVNETHPDGVLLANTILSKPTWSPDGEYVAYINLYEELETDTGPSSGSDVQEIDVYITELDTLITTNYTLDLNTSGIPVWSPDGSKIAFTSRARNIGQIYLIDPETGDITEIPERLRAVGQPIWSPDSRYLSFISNRLTNTGEVNTEVMVVDIETYEVQNISDSPHYDIEPVWSPDGRFIAFVSRRNTQHDIYIATLATGNIRRLTYSSEIESDLSWRPR